MVVRLVRFVRLEHLYTFLGDFTIKIEVQRSEVEVGLGHTMVRVRVRADIAVDDNIIPGKCA